MQAGHGKVAPLRRIQPGDHVVCYSPTETFGGKERLQAFTAIGKALDRSPYQFDMGDGFRPFRRDMAWFNARATEIQPLLDRLEFTAGVRNWGYKLRLGLFEISGHDLNIITAAMGVTVATAVIHPRPAGCCPSSRSSA